MIEDKIRDRLSYDVNTGLLSWRINVSKNVKAGAKAGHIRKDGYSRLCVDRQFFLAHRVAWMLHYGSWPTSEIDHLNGERHDNRIANLRDVSKSINLQNQRKATSKNMTGFLGVSWHARTKCYAARININGTEKHLGYFKTAEKAHEAYLSKKRMVHQGCTI
jgi:outer membrane protein assembly factor BamB